MQTIIRLHTMAPHDVDPRSVQQKVSEVSNMHVAVLDSRTRGAPGGHEVVTGMWRRYTSYEGIKAWLCEVVILCYQEPALGTFE
jgi:hypothetical protein